MTPELVGETIEQVELLNKRLKVAHDRQKSYADKHIKNLEFSVGDKVYLEMRTFRGSDPNRKLKKLRPSCVPAGTTVRISDFHDLFHISVLRKVVRESELILPRPPADAQRNLSLVSKPVKIVDEKEVDNRGRKVKMVLVRWTRDGIHEDVWEPEYHLRDDEKTKGGDGDGGDGEVSEERDELAGVLRAVVAADEGRDGRELREGVE
ncbi:PREDICTED: uncharacterized protein LOC106302866 [Brassica oleracea var. oleracea]|uniref:uncharacterized protein LOC106302866 n=1 Tax=Brassica oleracea var. oleracea TaxID=109376 RepID=UPI0006A6A608|nr:PREDICTED: uncharacterized protein LOC106302866 [Brassica oleracea var. oleracea]